MMGPTSVSKRWLWMLSWEQIQKAAGTVQVRDAGGWGVTVAGAGKGTDGQNPGELWRLRGGGCGKKGRRRGLGGLLGFWLNRSWGETGRGADWEEEEEFRPIPVCSGGKVKGPGARRAALPSWPSRPSVTNCLDALTSMKPPSSPWLHLSFFFFGNFFYYVMFVALQYIVSF